MNSHGKVEGSQFEALFEKAAKLHQVHFVRIPDGCKSMGTVLRRVPTPCDYVLIHKGVTVFIDCKTYDSDRIIYSHITPHQIETLSAIERSGCVAGYLIWLREESCVCFLKASRLAQVQPKDSLHGKDMIFLGRLDKKALSIEEFYLGRLFSIHLEKEVF